jgi:hypothetical protein
LAAFKLKWVAHSIFVRAIFIVLTVALNSQAETIETEIAHPGQPSTLEAVVVLGRVLIFDTTRSGFQG